MAAPPDIALPRRYNAEVDFVERHEHEGRGDKIAFIDGFGETSYAAFAERTRKAATVMLALGVAPEQRVALCLHDTADFPALFFGAIRAGVVPIPLNTLLTSDDYAFLLRDSRARVVFVSDALVPRLDPALANLSPDERPTVVVVRSPVGGDTHAHQRFEALVDAAVPLREAFDSTSDDVAFWLYSSGSTGKPKGALHLQSHLSSTAKLYASGVLGVREDDVIFSAAKLFFAYGLGNAMTFPLHAGATSVLLAERPTPGAVMRVLETHAPTLFCGVPTLFASLLGAAELAESRGSPRLRASISAGEALPAHVGQKWRERFGTDILDGIGSTEMLHIFLSNRHGEVRYGTSGRAVPGYELEIRDEAGKQVSDGEEGSLWVRGPSSAIAYWNQREKSITTFHGAWTFTGDRYVRDVDGYYTYAGRGDDMLKVGGIWVSPFEVESALAAHDAVLEAAVVGHADADGLVKPRAFVVLNAGVSATPELTSELQAFVKTRLAPYKYPRWIEFRSDLPKTATGKIQRFKLRA